MRGGWSLIAAWLIGTACAPPEPLRLNDLQILGSHNSYKRAIDAALLESLRADRPQVADSLDYAHSPLNEQLELGVRKFELDVFYDPQGGRYAAPAGLVAIAAPTPFDAAPMRLPGFKVLHVQDLDFRSHCARFVECLNTLVQWSRSFPRHVPIFITINAKAEKIERPGFVEPLPIDEPAWAALDQEILSVLGDRLLRPDDVRGTAADLRSAVLSRGWPSLDSARGKFLVVLDESGDKLASYVEGHPGLRGRAMFVNAEETAPEAGVLIINDPVASFERIQSLVRQGFIVRTRADADTAQARSGDTEQRDAAFASGAQIVSTDYYLPDQRFATGYQVALPFAGKPQGEKGLAARCNPVRRMEPCEISE